MVLDETSDKPANDSLYDSAPPSDDDPYASSNSPMTVQYHIDSSAFPKPFPIINPLLAYNPKSFEKVFQAKLKQSADILRRSPTQDEAQALAYWTARQLSIISLGGPIGILGGAWRAYSAAPTFRFPFWQPNLETFNSMRFGPIRGNRAVLAWHSARLVAYACGGNVIASILFGSYAMSVTAVGEVTDPRLKNYVSEIRNQARRSQGQLSGALGKGPQHQSSQEGQAGAPANNRGGVDDASPTGGAYNNDFVHDFEATTREGGFQSSEQTTSASFNSTMRKPQPNQLPRTAPIQEPQSQSFDPFGDDASPTDGQGLTGDTSAPKPQGSAWDKLRQGATTAPAGKTSSTWPNGRAQQQSGQSAWARQQEATQREQREGSTTGDAFSFSKTEQERSFAKDEAQKEFDARVERERRGGDFSGGSGDQKRW